jgi:hypothetical protein
MVDEEPQTKKKLMTFIRTRITLRVKMKIFTSDDCCPDASRVVAMRITAIIAKSIINV